jgi:hypothetical protein
VGDDEIRSIVNEINSHSHSLADETTEDVLAMGHGLVRLFGYNDRRRNIHIPAKTSMSKKRYPELGLKMSYAWAKRLMKISMDDKLIAVKYRGLLPRSRNALEQCARMSLARFEKGINPDPDQRGEIVIHPESRIYDLKAYRKQGAGIKQPTKHRQMVCVIILPDKPVTRAQQERADWELDDSLIDRFRNAAFGENLQFAIAQVESKKVKEAIFENTSQKQAIWTLDMGRIEKRPRRTGDE